MGIGALAVVVLMVLSTALQYSVAKSQASHTVLYVDRRVAEPVIRSRLADLGFLTMVTRKVGISIYPLPLLFSAVAAILVIVGSDNSWADVGDEAYVGNQIRMLSENGTDADRYLTLAVGTLTLIL